MRLRKERDGVLLAASGASNPEVDEARHVVCPEANTASDSVILMIVEPTSSAVLKLKDKGNREYKGFLNECAK